MGTKTTFERLGGFARVRLIVSDFYDKVLDSERLARHFAGIDMRQLIDHQTKFIAAIMGGPAAFSDEPSSKIAVNADPMRGSETRAPIWSPKRNISAPAVMSAMMRFDSGPATAVIIMPVRIVTVLRKR